MQQVSGRLLSLGGIWRLPEIFILMMSARVLFNDVPPHRSNHDWNTSRNSKAQRKRADTGTTSLETIKLADKDMPKRRPQRAIRC